MLFRSFAPRERKKDTTSRALRQPTGSAIVSTPSSVCLFGSGASSTCPPNARARCTDAQTRFVSGARASCASRDASALEASNRARRTCRMTRRVGGRRLLPADRAGEDGLPDASEGAGEIALELSGPGVTGRDFAFAFERSTHGFSGGTRGTVYWATAERDRSHRLGAHTPTSTRQAATSRLALLGASGKCQLKLEAAGCLPLVVI